MVVTGDIFPKQYANAITRHEQKKKYCPMQHQLVINKTKQALDILHWRKPLITLTSLYSDSLMEITQWTKYWIRQKYFCPPFVLVYYQLMLHGTIFLFCSCQVIALASSISSDDSSEKALDDSYNSGTRQKPNKHLTYYIEENT